MATPKKTDQGTWRIQIEVRGTRDGGTFESKRAASDWAAQRTTELRALNSGLGGTIKTLGDALRRYAEEVSPTHRGERWEVVRIAAYLKPDSKLPVKKKLADLTTEDIADWRDLRLKKNSRGTVLRDLGLLSAVLEQCRLEWKWVSVNPIKDVRRPANPDHREVLITGPQVRKMLRALDYGTPVRSITQAVAMCFLTALATGMRAGELCGLTWVNVYKDHCVLPMTKSGKKRVVPLSSVALRLIERMRGFDAVLVFGLKSQSLDALFRRARKRAGLDGFTMHDSRHTAATRIAKRPEIDVLTLCKIFGWSNPKMAMVYYNPKISDLAKRLG